MKLHLRHGASKNAETWRKSNEASWYEKYGQFNALCWAHDRKNTTDDASLVTCKVCLKKA